MSTSTTPLGLRPHALYRFFDADGVLLYIGITAALPTRLTSHNGDKPWWTEVARITIEHHTDRESVLAAEKAAILDERPRWNVVHNRSQVGGVTVRPRRSQELAVGDQWTFSTHRGGPPRTTPLWLYWEVSGDPISEDYSVHDIDPADLWREWLTRKPRDETAEAIFGAGAFPIHWFVEGHGTFESAPFRDLQWEMACEREAGWVMPERRRSHFLKHYTWPVNAVTGDQVQWSRLPVIDKVWRTTNLPDLHEFKGGFIQEATGWKPASLQPYVDVVQLARMAGPYVPDRRPS